MVSKKNSLSSEQLRDLVGGSIQPGVVYKDKQAGTYYVDPVDPSYYEEVNTHIIYDNDTGEAIAHATNEEEARKYDQMYHNRMHKYYHAHPIMIPLGRMETLNSIYSDDLHYYGF